MKEDLTLTKKGPSEEFTQILEETLRKGAQKLLQKAIENEVQEFVDAFAESRIENGRRSVIRNGYLPRRSVQTGLGPISIRQPRVRDKEKKNAFTSAILPPYMRRTQASKPLFQLFI